VKISAGIKMIPLSPYLTITVGADEANAFEWAQDALVVALTGYIEERRDIPPPSKQKRGQELVHLPAQVAMKLVKNL